MTLSHPVPDPLPWPAPADEPVILSALLTVGHDGEAEAIVELRFPNGAQQGVTFTCESLAGALDRAGITDLEGLVGHPWSVLLGTE